MLKMLENHKELKQIYTFEKYPSDSWDYAYNLGERQGISSMNNDCFTPYLNKLIKQGILEEVYDFVKDGQREALFQFSNGSEIEFFGTDYMNFRIFYNY